MYSPELSSKIALWRAKCAENTITKEELTEFARLLREERRSAAVASATKKSRAKAAAPNADDLLKELE